MSQPGALRAELNFLAPKDAYQYERPVYVASEGGADAGLYMTGQFELVAVDMLNARAEQEPPTLDREGFALVDQPSAVSDFYDDGQVSAVYEAEVRGLVAAATGASRVVVFDFTRRGDSRDVRAERHTREPSTVMHNDYTDVSAIQRVRDILPDEADDLLSRRFAIVNVWRPINNPVETSPLALSDARSLNPDNLVVSERRAKERIGELTLVTHNPAQRWMYYPRMTPDEALLIKTYDTADDGRARFSVHGAFDDPTSPPDAPPRESIETRTFAFFD